MSHSDWDKMSLAIVEILKLKGVLSQNLPAYVYSIYLPSYLYLVPFHLFHSGLLFISKKNGGCIYIRITCLNLLATIDTR